MEFGVNENSVGVQDATLLCNLGTYSCLSMLLLL